MAVELCSGTTVAGGEAAAIVAEVAAHARHAAYADAFRSRVTDTVIMQWPVWQQLLVDVMLGLPVCDDPFVTAFEMWPAQPCIFKANICDVVGGCAAVKVEVTAMAGGGADAVTRVQGRVSAWRPLATAEAGLARSVNVVQRHPPTWWVFDGHSRTDYLAIWLQPFCSPAAEVRQRSGAQCKAGQLLCSCVALAVVAAISGRVHSLPLKSGQCMPLRFPP